VLDGDPALPFSGGLQFGDVNIKIISATV